MADAPDDGDEFTGVPADADSDETLEEIIATRPLIAVAIAALFGFVLVRLVL